MMDELQKAIIGVHILSAGTEVSVFDTIGTGLKKYSDDQPRDENGRFGSGGGSGAGEKTDESNGGGGHSGGGAARDAEEGRPFGATAASLATSIRETGGFTYSPVQGAPTTGYMVSVNPEHEQSAEMDKMTGTKLESAVQSYMDSKDAITRGDTSKFMGAWVDSGKTTFDISTHSSDKEAALKMGTEHGQQAIWDIVNMESIPCPARKLWKKGEDAKGVHLVFGHDMTAKQIAAAIAATAVAHGWMTEEQVAE